MDMDLYRELYLQSVDEQMKMATLIGKLNAALTFIQVGFDPMEEATKAKALISEYYKAKGEPE